MASLLLAGAPNNELAPGDPNRAFPPALVDALAMPLAADFRGFEKGRHRIGKPPYDLPWYAVLANLYDVSRELVEDRERKRIRRQRRTQVAIGSVALAGLVGAVAWNIWTRSDSHQLQRSLSEGEKLVATTDPAALHWWVTALAAEGNSEDAIAAALKNEDFWDQIGLLMHASDVALAAERKEDAQAYIHRVVEIALRQESAELSSQIEAALKLGLEDDARRLLRHALANINSEDVGDSIRQLENLVSESVSLGLTQELLDTAAQKLDPDSFLEMALFVVQQGISVKSNAAAELGIQSAIRSSAQISSAGILTDDNITTLLRLCFQNRLSKSCASLAEGLQSVGEEAQTTLAQLIVDLMQKGQVDEATQLSEKLKSLDGSVLDETASENQTAALTAEARGLKLVGNTAAAAARFELAEAAASASPDPSGDQLVMLVETAVALQNRERAQHWARAAWAVAATYNGTEPMLSTLRALASAGLQQEALDAFAWIVAQTDPDTDTGVPPESLLSGVLGPLPVGTAAPTQTDGNTWTLDLDAGPDALARLTTDLYRSGLENAALAVARSASSRSESTLLPYMAFLESAYRAGHTERYKTALDESLRRAVLGRETAPGAPGIEELTSQIAGEGYAPQARASLERIADELARKANPSEDDSYDRYLSGFSSWAEAAVWTASGLGLVGAESRQTQLLIWSLETPSAKSEEADSTVITTALSLLSKKNLTGAERKRIDNALAAIGKPLLEDPEKVGEAVDWLVAVHTAGFLETASRHLNELLARLETSSFAWVEIGSYPKLVCGLTLLDRNLDAMRVADLTAADLRLVSYSIVAAGIASRRWPDPRNATKDLICELKNP